MARAVWAEMSNLTLSYTNMMEQLFMAKIHVRNVRKERGVSEELREAKRSVDRARDLMKTIKSDLIDAIKRFNMKVNTYVYLDYPLDIITAYHAVLLQPELVLYCGVRSSCSALKIALLECDFFTYFRREFKFTELYRVFNSGGNVQVADSSAQEKTSRKFCLRSSFRGYENVHAVGADDTEDGDDDAGDGDNAHGGFGGGTSSGIGGADEEAQGANEGGDTAAAGAGGGGGIGGADEGGDGAGAGAAAGADEGGQCAAAAAAAAAVVAAAADYAADADDSGDAGDV